MSDLLAIGRSGILAYRDALAGVSENVVNANTDGFARRQVKLTEQAGNVGAMYLYRASTNFNGVRAAEVSRVWDQYRANNAWNANSDAAMAQSRTQYLSSIEQGLNDSAAGVGVRLSAIFTSATTLSASPGDLTLRQSFVYAVEEGAAALTKTEASLLKLGETVTGQARSLTNEINEALVALGRVNVALKGAPEASSGRAAQEDQRDALIGRISAAMGVDVSLDAAGAATLRLNDRGGAVLLSASDNVPSSLRVQAADDGRLAFTVRAVDGSSDPVTVVSGKLAAMTGASTLIADRRRQLDGIAAQLADELNAWQQAGTDLAGDEGAPLLSGSTAADLKLVLSGPAGVAAAKGNAGNGNLLALQNLRGPGGVEDKWRALVSDQSLRVFSAEAEEASAVAQKDSAFSELDAVSGVDLDAEAADLMRFQQAYSASAKIIQTARETLEAVLQLL
jgi:flagellar hook-associated protein 1